MQVTSGRISYIDFLKFIGLTGIIIAHIGAPDWLLTLRSFDVPFMVILSSLLGERSFAKFEANRSGIQKYYGTRIKRLVFPTWIFLCVYFLIVFLDTGEANTFEYYLMSFMLTRYGVGYVWIILIYLYSALLIPVYNKIKLSKAGLIALFIIYILYETAYYNGIGTTGRIMNTTFYYIIPYGVLTYLGFNYHRIKPHVRYIIIGSALALFAAIGVYYWLSSGEIVLVQKAKYPPRAYYLAYGIGVSFLLLVLCEKKEFRIYKNPVIAFISKNSMWIYLWHVLVLYAYERFKMPEVWYLKLVIVYAASMSIVFVVNLLLDKIEGNKKINFLRYLRG